MKSNMITKAMIKNHAILIKILDEFEKNIIKDKINIMKIFDEFVWDIEKHLFTEEKVIFISYQLEDKPEGYSIVPRLMSEHSELLNRLKEMKINIMKHQEIDFKGFKEILIKHKDFEDESVYPFFDQELDESEKIKIIKRINEIQLTQMGGK